MEYPPTCKHRTPNLSYNTYIAHKMISQRHVSKGTMNKTIFMFKPLNMHEYTFITVYLIYQLCPLFHHHKVTFAYKRHPGHIYNQQIQYFHAIILSFFNRNKNIGNINHIVKHHDNTLPGNHRSE
jgi:hypothetical protein